MAMVDLGIRAKLSEAETRHKLYSEETFPSGSELVAVCGGKVAEGHDEDNFENKVIDGIEESGGERDEDCALES